MTDASTDEKNWVKNFTVGNKDFITINDNDMVIFDSDIEWTINELKLIVGMFEKHEKAEI